MSNISKHRVLIAGILSPIASAFLGALIYLTLTRVSADLNNDFVFRLSMVSLAMTLPFLATLALALADRRGAGLNLSGKVGLGIAVLSLFCMSVPLRALVGRIQQARNASTQGVTAPPFETADISGQIHRLGDHRGKVVLINAWATWCPPCREEMPKLDQLYQRRKQEGLMVFGLSTEDLELQQRFVKEQLQVSYPLLTINGNVPSMYREIERWPALFLIDRRGRLQPVAQAGEPFAKVEAAVDALLKAGM